jgi:hypothetical protein
MSQVAIALGGANCYESEYSMNKAHYVYSQVIIFSFHKQQIITVPKNVLTKAASEQ